MIRGYVAAGAEAFRAHRGEVLGAGLLFAGVAAYLVVQALRVDTYALLVDELLYVKAAQGFADNPLTATVFGEPHAVPNALYSRLLALPYALVGSINAFAAGHAMNALLFASTIVPVYLLARRLGAAPRWSLVGAAFAVVVPWAVATLALMAESLAYPVFAWAVLAVVVAIADPRPRNDALLVAVLMAMVYARTQFIVVLPAAAVALVAHELAWPGRAPGELAARARRHWLLGAAALIGAVVAFVIQPDFLGNYSSAIDHPRFPTHLLDSMADHLGHLIVGVGVVPALLWVAAVHRGGSTPARREEHVFAYFSGVTVLLVAYQAGFFSRQVAGGNLQERYAFYLAALFAVGAAVMLARPPRRAPLGSLLTAAAVAALLVATSFFPEDRFGVRVLLSAASKFNGELADFAGSLRPSWTVPGTLAVVTGVVAAATLAAFGAGRFRHLALPALAAATLLFCAYETHFVLQRAIPEINEAIPGELAHPPKAWVDGLLVAGDDEAGAVEGRLPAYTAAQWQWVEFWNERVTRVYSLPGRPPVSGLPGTRMRVDARSGRIAADPELPLLVVSAEEPALGIQGEEVRTIVTGQRLIRPVRPYRAAWAYGDASTAAIGRGPTALAVYPPSPAMRTARVAIDVAAVEEGGRARWAAVTESERVIRSGSGHAELEVRLDPGEARGVVSLSAPEAGDEPDLALARVSVEWSE